MRINMLSSIIGGIVLCILLITSSFLPYLEMQHMLLPLIVFGGILIAVVILYRNYSFKYAVLRMSLMFACCIILTRLLAFAGIIGKINDILCILESEANSRASGLGMTLFLIILIFEGTIISGILLIHSWIKKHST